MKREYTPSRARANAKYNAEKCDDIKLRPPKGTHAFWKEVAESEGLSVTRMVMAAVEEHVARKGTFDAYQVSFITYGENVVRGDVAKPTAASVKVIETSSPEAARVEFFDFVLREIGVGHEVMRRTNNILQTRIVDTGEREVCEILSITKRNAGG